jgi:hypothetical protein
MQPVAIGIRPHSGWGAVVVVAGGSGAIEIVDRRKIVIADPTIQGANQPYHFAKDLPDPDRYLVECAAASERLAWEALREVVSVAQRRQKAVAGCVILLASGRKLPALANILASHPLIHTAEGEFFRQAFRRAGERLKLPVTGIRERDLNDRSQMTFGAGAKSLQHEIASLGNTLGPPWTADQKNACLAALLVLNQR